MPATSSTNHRLPVRMLIQKHERLHKLFAIHDTARAGDNQFRVFTKENHDGTLELLGYTYRFDGRDEHQSNVLRAPSVPPDMLLPVIRNLVAKTHTDIQQMEVIDLTTSANRLDQADRLAQHELLDAFDFE